MSGVWGGDVVRFLHVAVDDEQLGAWKVCAAGRDLSLSAWVRMTLDREGVVGTPDRGVTVDKTPRDPWLHELMAQKNGVFALDCPGTHTGGVRCDGCGGSKW